jgi:hypothetical protein
MLTAQGPRAAGGARDYVVDGRQTGGYALVAWPASYGTSGVMSFLVNQDGIVWQPRPRRRHRAGRRRDHALRSRQPVDADPGRGVAQKR